MEIVAVSKHRIRCFHEFVPDAMRFWLLIVLSLVWLLSGAAHMASLNYQVGRLSFLQEDAVMIGYMAFIGMNISFPILFRLRFRFTSRTLFLFCTAILIACHIATLYTDHVGVLCLLNLIAGFFRMLAVFEAMVCIQLQLTPTRNYAVFYSVVFLIVQGSSQLFSPVVAELIHAYSWQYMQLMIVALLIATLLIVLLFTRPFCEGKPIPLYGIDWSGFVLWTTILSLILFIITYGKYFEWLESVHIRFAMIALPVVCLLQYFNTITVKRPYISPSAWRYPNLWKILLLFGVIYILQAAPGSLQNSYMASVLGFDQRTVAHLNLWSLAGMCLSAFFCYRFFTIRRGLRPFLVGGYCLFILYMALMYFWINPECNIERFYSLAFIRGFGLLWLYILLTLYVSYIVPFAHNFQALCIIGFMRMSLGTPLGISLIDNLMLYFTRKNTMLLSVELDAPNVQASGLPLSELQGLLTRQVSMLSAREMFGYMLIAALLLLIGLLFERQIKPGFIRLAFPNMTRIRSMIRQSLLKIR